MSLGAAEVRRVAALAALDVPEADLPGLVAELSQIVEYVGRLAQVPPMILAPAHPVSGLVLRADTIDPSALPVAPAAMAPEFLDGFFLVPRLEAMGDG